MKKLLLIWLFSVLLHFPNIECVQAETAISVQTLPYEISLDDDPGALLTNNYGTVTWGSSGCYSGSCVKIVPAESTGNAREGLSYWTLTSVQPNHFFVRVMVFLGTSLAANSIGTDTQNKFIEVKRNSNGERMMTILEEYDSAPYYTWGACLDNECYYQCGGSENCLYPNGSDTWKSSDYGGQWFCIEVETDLVNGVTNVYLTTADGAFSGVYKSRGFDVLPSDWFSEVTIIGGFWNGIFNVDENTYLLIDEIIFDDEYIGPPDGFVSTATPSYHGVTFRGVGQ